MARFSIGNELEDFTVQILRNGQPFGAGTLRNGYQHFRQVVGLTAGDIHGPVSNRRTVWIGFRDDGDEPEPVPALRDECYGTAVRLDHLPTSKRSKVETLAQYVIEERSCSESCEVGELVLELDVEDDSAPQDLLTPMAADEVRRIRNEDRLHELLEKASKLLAPPSPKELQRVLDELAELLEKRVPPETAASPAATTTTKTQRETGSGQPNAAASENAPPADTAQPPTPASTEPSARPAEPTAQPPSPSQQVSSSRSAATPAEARPESEPARVTQETPSPSTEPATEEAPAASATSDEAKREAAMQKMVDEFTGIAREMDDPHDLLYMAAFMATSDWPDLLLETARNEPSRKPVTPHEAAGRQVILDRAIKALRKMANPEKLLEMARIMRDCVSPSGLLRNVLTTQALARETMGDPGQGKREAARLPS